MCKTDETLIVIEQTMKPAIMALPYYTASKTDGNDETITHITGTSTRTIFVGIRTGTD